MTALATIVGLGAIILVAFAIKELTPDWKLPSKKITKQTSHASTLLNDSPDLGDALPDGTRSLSQESWD